MWKSFSGSKVGQAGLQISADLDQISVQINALCCYFERLVAFSCKKRRFCRICRKTRTKLEREIRSNTLPEARVIDACASPTRNSTRVSAQMQLPHSKDLTAGWPISAACTGKFSAVNSTAWTFAIRRAMCRYFLLVFFLTLTSTVLAEVTPVKLQVGVKGILETPAGPTQRAVLLLHGWNADMDEVGNLYADLAGKLAKRGIASFRFSFSGEGARTGYVVTSTFDLNSPVEVSTIDCLSSLGPAFNFESGIILLLLPS